MEKMTKADLIKEILSEERDVIEDEEVLDILVRERLSQDVHIASRKRLSFGDKMSDRLAKSAGSWKFIIGFSLALMFWIVLNVYMLEKPYDPYPFILLNLVLSCVAALQAPIIMMSQNRQEEKDRLRAKNDYKVNLKSEIIIEDTYEKLDRLLENQQKYLENLIRLEDKLNQK